MNTETKTLLKIVDILKEILSVILDILNVYICSLNQGILFLNSVYNICNTNTEHFLSLLVSYSFELNFWP